MSAGWRARVYVMPKEEVLDPEGSAIAEALRQLGFSGVGAVRGGRLFDLHITTGNRAGAEALATRAAERLLCNPVVETFTLEVEPEES